MIKRKRKKILWHIFPSFLIITVISLAAVTWYTTSFFKKFFLNNTEEELSIRAELIKRELRGHDYETMHRLCREIGKSTDTRVTVILPSGEVVGDSFGTIENMNNHGSRHEIRLALQGHKGVSLRFSQTLGKNMMYIALPNKENNNIKFVVRVAVPVASMEEEISSVHVKILMALLATLVSAALASLFVARRISRPIEEMTAGAGEFTKGNLTHKLALPDSEELSLLATTMNQMAATLNEKIKAVENRKTELEAVQSSMREGLIAVDLNEQIITANHSAATIFDHPISKIQGRNIHEIARDYDLQCFIKKALSVKEPMETDIILQRQEKRVYDIHSTALCNAGGERLGTLIIFHDITRIRHLENMHKNFAANVSHELKTPLTSIKGFVETLQDQMEEKDAAKEIEFLRIIEKNVNRLIALINDLMALSRVERQEGATVELEVHDLNQVISDAVETCRMAHRNKTDAVEIETRCPENHSALLDPILMQQAIVNLLDNAVKYSPENKKVQIKMEKKENDIVISIQDSGPGISRDQQSKIFQRFYRVDKARSRDMGGTGLGLAIVKHIVKYHKGEICLKSIPGKGSTFEIKLPAITS